MFTQLHEAPRIRNFNIAFYAMIMGFGGFAIATRKLEEAYHTGTHFYEFFLYFTLLAFVVVSVVYLAKIITHFAEVKKDFLHPVKSNFFPGVGKILLIFAIGFLAINRDIATILWILGVVVQGIFTLIIFRRWMLHEMDMKLMNPLWFLPVVGNMLAPVAGVPLGFVELSWFFFSIGIVMWAVLFTLIMNRIIFHPSLPEKLMPTLFILVAPPAVAFISMTTLSGGEFTIFGKVLYLFSLFLFLINLTKVNIFAKLKFYMSSWAYSFPMAVFTTGTMLYYVKTGIGFYGVLGIIFYVILVLILLFLIYKTIIGMRKGELCVEE